MTTKHANEKEVALLERSRIPAEGIRSCLQRARSSLERRELDSARELYEALLLFSPGSVNCLSGIGAIELLQGNFNKAVDVYKHVIAIRPDLRLPYYNLGSALYGLGHLGEAEKVFRQVASIKDFPLGDIGLSAIYLARENYAQGWPLFERRFELPGLAKYVPKSITWWQGEQLHRKRILVWAEQGSGDTLQFLRYVRRVKEMGAHVILKVPQRLARLASIVEGVDQVVSMDAAVDDIDFHCPLMSLAIRCADPSDPYQSKLSYLSPHAGTCPPYETSDRNVKLKVGLAWWGDPLNTRNLQRSITLKHFASLADIPKVSFLSLQRGEGCEQMKDVPNLRLLEPEKECRDFADSAALIASLDLVISIDTSVAHAAGALGKPLWVLLHHSPSWQWLISRRDSPWYPTATLFRQSSPGDWTTVLVEVARALQDLAARSTQ